MAPLCTGLFINPAGAATPCLSPAASSASRVPPQNQIQVPCLVPLHHQPSSPHRQSPSIPSFSASSPRAAAAGNQRLQAVPCSLPSRAALSKSLISLASPSLYPHRNKWEMPWPPAEAPSSSGSSSSGLGLGSDVSNGPASLLPCSPAPRPRLTLHLTASPTLPDFAGVNRPSKPVSARSVVLESRAVASSASSGRTCLLCARASPDLRPSSSTARSPDPHRPLLDLDPGASPRSVPPVPAGSRRPRRQGPCRLLLHCHAPAAFVSSEREQQRLTRVSVLEPVDRASSAWASASPRPSAPSSLPLHRPAQGPG
ncbi:putative protein TPRXL [Triticum dicoccoides]|uniref:putative protein TPRXL n=1 Tax=Triticum dicoccoides TaxID=85692 RepID=UPI00188E8A38|nr:putative protein TPRXL [Triticum dicoccoides]